MKFTATALLRIHTCTEQKQAQSCIFLEGGVRPHCELLVLLQKSVVFLEGFALTWSFWDMTDMSDFRLLVRFRTFRFQNRLFEVIS